MNKYLILCIASSVAGPGLVTAVASPLPQCEVVVRATAVAGAATYELYASTARYCPVPCNMGQSLFVVPNSRRMVATADVPQWSVDSSPAFDGVWEVVARSAAGAPLATQYVGEVGARAAIGRPFLATGATAVTACLHEQVTLSPVASTDAAAFQWYHDGFPIPGATESSLSFEVDASHAGAVYTCVASNGCGSTTAGPFMISVTPGVAEGLVDWRSCVETESLAQSGGLWWCSVYNTVSVRQGSCNAQWSTLSPSGFSFTGVQGGSGSRTTSASFELHAPALLVYTSTSTPINCFGTIFERSSATLTGPVAANLKPNPTGGSGSITLPTGVYTVVARVSDGGLIGCGWQCTTCGPTCITTCASCNAWGNLGLVLSFVPIPFDVPDRYPTIQSAIDAVSPGVAQTITIAPGVYNQPFALNGKDVVLQGSTLGATIIDGTGFAGPIARFTGGEPPTAGLERLTFRNGLSGSAVGGEGSFSGGGAIWAEGSSAFVRDCRFETCAADIGGAIYLTHCHSGLERCTFVQNSATSAGGAVYLNESSVLVASCSFVENTVGVNRAGAGSALLGVGVSAAGEMLRIVGCTFTGNRGIISASAVEYREGDGPHPGRMQISECTITGNISGSGMESGAAGLRVYGAQSACVVTSGTTICGNTPEETLGPFILEADAEICGCPSDLNEDGFVLASDLVRVFDAWLQAGTLEEDINHDGRVDMSDLAELLASWGSCPG